MSDTHAPAQQERLVQQRLDGPVATLELNRPDKRNAISLAMVHELDRCLGELPASVKVVILAARGEHFSAGLDLSEVPDMSAAQGVHHSHAWYRCLSACSSAACR